MPFLQAESEEYTSEVAITSPLPDFKSSFTPVSVFLITNSPIKLLPALVKFLVASKFYNKCQIIAIYNFPI